MADENLRPSSSGGARGLLRSVTSSLRLPFFRRNRHNNVAPPELVEDPVIAPPPPIPNGIAPIEELPPPPPSPPLPPRSGQRTIIFTFEDVPSVIFIASGDFSSGSSLQALVELIRRMNFDDVLNESFLLHQRQRSGAAPASTEQLQSIKEGPTTAAEIGELCPVCQEHLQENENVIRLPCSHCYHTECGMTWLKGARLIFCCICNTYATAHMQPFLLHMPPQ